MELLRETQRVKEILTTERLVLREMTMADLPAMRAIMQDEETMYAINRAIGTRGMPPKPPKLASDIALMCLGLMKFSHLSETQITRL